MPRPTSKAKPVESAATRAAAVTPAPEGLSIAGVARQAGVSVATVSRVLNAHENVRPATRDKVLAAIDASGYRVNELARNLRNRGKPPAADDGPRLRQSVLRRDRARHRQHRASARLFHASVPIPAPTPAASAATSICCAAAARTARSASIRDDPAGARRRRRARCRGSRAASSIRRWACRMWASTTIGPRATPCGICCARPPAHRPHQFGRRLPVRAAASARLSRCADRGGHRAARRLAHESEQPRLRGGRVGGGFADAAEGKGGDKDKRSRRARSSPSPTRSRPASCTACAASASACRRMSPWSASTTSRSPRKSIRRSPPSPSRCANSARPPRASCCSGSRIRWRTCRACCCRIGS